MAATWLEVAERAGADGRSEHKHVAKVVASSPNSCKQALSLADTVAGSAPISAEKPVSRSSHSGVSRPQ